MFQLLTPALQTQSQSCLLYQPPASLPVPTSQVSVSSMELRSRGETKVEVRDEVMEELGMQEEEGGEDGLDPADIGQESR